MRGVTQALVLVVCVLACLGVIGVVVFATAFGLGAGMASTNLGTAAPDGYVHMSGERQSPNKLLTVRIEGPILGAPPRNRSSIFVLPGFTFGYQVQELLEQAAESDEIKGVLLHLQTPGGTIFGSRAIHDGVMRYREQTSKPVVAYVEGLSASGGVMAMVGATRILADHGSLIGSIGVLGPQLLFFNRPVATDGGLLAPGIVTEDGIEQTMITAGRGKDLGNPFRRPTEEEVATLTRGVEAEYEQFVMHVAANRRIDPEVIRDRMGAMVFDNGAAQAFGLIDGTASHGEAVRALAMLADVAADYEVVRPGEEDIGMLWRMLGARLAVTPARTLSAADVIRAEFCASVRAPLAYYGDPGALCR